MVAIQFKCTYNLYRKLTVWHRLSKLSVIWKCQHNLYYHIDASERKPCRGRTCSRCSEYSVWRIVSQRLASGAGVRSLVHIVRLCNPADQLSDMTSHTALLQQCTSLLLLWCPGDSFSYKHTWCNLSTLINTWIRMRWSINLQFWTNVWSSLHHITVLW